MHIIFSTKVSFAPTTDAEQANIKHLDNRRILALAWMRRNGIEPLKDRKTEKFPSLLLRQAN